MCAEVEKRDPEIQNRERSQELEAARPKQFKDRRPRGLGSSPLKELAEALPDDYPKRIKRKGIVNARDDPDFKAAIERTGRKQLIMAAVTTDICLICPAIMAVAGGYEVQAAPGASGSPTEFPEEMARRRMDGTVIVLTATNTLISELTQDWSSAEGSQLQEIMRPLGPPVQMLSASEGAGHPLPTRHWLTTLGPISNSHNEVRLH